MSRIVLAAANAEPAHAGEQLRYARWLDAGARLGFVLLVLGFGAYASGLWPAHVPLERLPSLWSLPVDSFRQAAGMPAGWHWLRLVHHSDVVNLLGIALLAGCSLPALLALLPAYARRGDRAFLFICQAEILVQLVAASGLVAGGH